MIFVCNPPFWGVQSSFLAFDTLNVYGKYCKRRIFREAQFLGQNNSK